MNRSKFLPQRRKDARGQRIVEKYLKKSLSYAEYVKLIDDLLLEGKTTGTNQSYAMFNYGKLNRQRMHRLEKTVTLEPETVFSIRSLDVKWIWLVITEGWCGDAAQNIPIIEKIVAENPGIETRYILRDENLDLMDQYLTNGARSIPKLIALDADTLEVLGTWGARPKAAQELFYQLKEQGIEKPQIMERLQRWYNNDHSRSIQREFREVTAEWAEESRGSRDSLGSQDSLGSRGSLKSLESLAG